MALLGVGLVVDDLANTTCVGSVGLNLCPCWLPVVPLVK